MQTKNNDNNKTEEVDLNSQITTEVVNQQRKGTLM